MSEPRSFPPDVFARLVPDTYLDRHLDEGLRPTGRAFDEFRPVNVQKSQRTELVRGALGAAVARAGQCTVMCGVSGGLTDFEGEGGIYANVEMHRGGRAGAPSPEEMVLSQRVHQLVEAARFDPVNFRISLPNSVHPCRKELVLTASIRVLSRTGPSLDIVWAALIAALEDTAVPAFYLDEKTQTVRPDFSQTHAIVFPEDLARSVATFGVARGQIIADPDGPTEESSITDHITVAKPAGDTLSGVSISVPQGTVTIENIKEAFAMAGKRTVH